MSRKPRSPEGMQVVASTREPPPSKPEPTDTLAAVAPSGWKVRHACGHRYPKKFKMDFYGDVRAVSAELLRKRERCGDCMAAWLKEIAIRCVLCGGVILPGEGVAAYMDDPSFKEAWKTRIGDDGIAVLGCLSMDCCPSGGFFAGHWTLQGYRPRYAHGSAMAEAIATGKPVIGNT